MDDQDRTTIRRFVFGAVVIILVVGLVWFFFMKHKGNDPIAATGNKPATSQSKAETPRSGTTPNPPPSATPNTPQTAQNQANADREQRQAAQLANAGPGNTVVIFIAAAAMGTVFHHYAWRNRLSYLKINN